MKSMEGKEQGNVPWKGNITLVLNLRDEEILVSWLWREKHYDRPEQHVQRHGVRKLPDVFQEPQDRGTVGAGNEQVQSWAKSTSLRTFYAGQELGIIPYRRQTNVKTSVSLKSTWAIKKVYLYLFFSIPFSDFRAFFWISIFLIKYFSTRRLQQTWKEDWMLLSPCLRFLSSGVKTESSSFGCQNQSKI